MSKSFCKFGGCDRLCYGHKDLCKAHYQQIWRGNKLQLLRTSPSTPLSERIVEWKKLAGTNEKGCWIWHQFIDEVSKGCNGYGQVSFGNRRNHKVHKLVWEHFNGPVPEGKELDHLCRVRACWNPRHLEAVTHKVNMERGDRATRTHCPVGHPYDSTNTYTDSRNQRRCRTCNREDMRRRNGYYERRKAA